MCTALNVINSTDNDLLYFMEIATERHMEKGNKKNNFKAMRLCLHPLVLLTTTNAHTH